MFKSAANIGILSDAAIMKTSEDFYLMHHLEELGHISKVQEVLCWDVLLHSTVWGGYFNQHDKKIKNWKATLLNTIQHLPKDQLKQSVNKPFIVPMGKPAKV